MATVSLRSGRAFRMAPTTMTGRVALAVLAVSLLLLLGRLFLTPAFGLPLNYLVVLSAAAVSGVLALFAVTLRHERGAAVIATMVIGLFAALWLAAEGLGGGGNPQVTLGDGDNGRSFTVARGTVLSIQLEGNPTTGYSWESSVGSRAVLNPTNDGDFKPSSSALGAGGTYTFQYQALARGRTDVTLVYRRSWETGVEPLKTFQVTIVVR